MELLNMKEQEPEDFQGKTINVLSNEYIIGRLVGEGGYKLVYQLINVKSGLCHFVLRIPIDQELASGIVKQKDRNPYNGKSCYDYYRWLAKKTYNYDGYNEKGSLPVFADFLDIPEFSMLTNKYNGIFNVVEFFNDAGDDNTSGIYPNLDMQDLLTLLKIRLNKDSKESKEQRDTCELCLSYLEKTNTNDDNIVNTYIRSRMRMPDCSNDRDKLIAMSKKLLSIEPFFKRNIYTAVSVYFYFGMWHEIINTFESIKDLIYEPYSIEEFMVAVVHAYRQLNNNEKAEVYSKYIRPSYKLKILSD